MLTTCAARSVATTQDGKIIARGMKKVVLHVNNHESRFGGIALLHAKTTTTRVAQAAVKLKGAGERVGVTTLVTRCMYVCILSSR